MVGAGRSEGRAVRESNTLTGGSRGPPSRHARNECRERKKERRRLLAHPRSSISFEGFPRVPPRSDRVADLSQDHVGEVELHALELRRDGVRTSKVELIEMLLWEMPASSGIIGQPSTFASIVRQSTSM